MKIEFNSAVNFESLKVGEFFIGGCGQLYLKIPKEQGVNAICFNDVQKGNPSLYCFTNNCKCWPCEGKIEIVIE